MHRHRFFGCVFVLVLASMALPAALQASETLQALQSEYNALFEKARKSIVAVRKSGGMRAESEFVAPAGLTATSNSIAGFVVEGGYVVTYAGNISERDVDPGSRFSEPKSVTVYRPGGVSATCEVVGVDRRNLLVVAKLPADWNIPALPLLGTELPPMGATVAAIGNSFDSILIDRSPSMALGSLSDTYRLTRVNPYDLNAEPTLYRGNLIEFEGAVNPGDAGGPLLDMEGRVIGMMTPLVNFGRQQGTAVPVSQLKISIDAIRKGETLPHPRLGYSVTPHASGTTKGKRVTDVTPDSAAAKAGLQVDDIIMAVDGEMIDPVYAIGEIIGWGAWSKNEESGTSGKSTYGLPPGTRITFLVYREMQYRTLTMTAGGLAPLGPYTASRELVSQRSAIERSALCQSASESVVSVTIMRNSRSGSNKDMGIRQSFLDLTIGPNTGVVVGSEGEILICDSILGPFVSKEKQRRNVNLSPIFVTLSDGRSYRAEVTGRDRGSDLALLKISAKGLKPAVFTGPNVGVGNALHVLARSYTVQTCGARYGICSAFDRNNGKDFQIDAKIGAADLGGLIIDTKGNPLGVVTNLDVATVGQASGVAFASHNSTILKSLELLRRGEFQNIPPTPFLGVTASAIFVDKPGLKITTVTPSSGAALAGVQENDILLKAGGVDLYDIGDLRRVIFDLKVNDPITLIVERATPDGGSQEKELVATLGSRE